MREIKFRVWNKNTSSWVNELMLNSDYVIKNNIFIKHRNGAYHEYISDEEIEKFKSITFFYYIAYRPIPEYKDNYPDMETNLTKKEIELKVKKYLEIEKQIEPLIDEIAKELGRLYPKLSKDEKVDWAMEFINADGDCEDVFKRLDSLSLPW